MAQLPASLYVCCKSCGCLRFIIHCIVNDKLFFTKVCEMPQRAHCHSDIGSVQAFESVMDVHFDLIAVDGLNIIVTGVKTL